MYYKVNPQKFRRVLITIYILITLITTVIGVQRVNARNLEESINIQEIGIRIEEEIEYVTIERVEIVEEVKLNSPFEMTEIGEFIVTGYTNADRTNTEIMRDYEGVSVAADPEVIPYGTKVWIEGIGIRQVQPSNQNIKGNELKVFFNTEEDKNTFGEKIINIYKVVD